MARKIHRLDSETASKDVSGNIYIVTGANSGVGLETTRHLVKQGGHVVMACRRPSVGEEAAQSFTGLKGSYEVMACDLADLQSVRDFVAAFQTKHDRLDGLACNAGMLHMERTPKYTKDGFEVTMAVSYFGHFLLTELLLDLMRKSAPARMVIVSSVGHAGSPKSRPKVDVDDLNFKNRPYNNIAAYAEAKVATNL
ncbi:MAG: SDR family NAD(P)-dependent oxidoreductase [Chloroflexota bacterium]